MILSLHSSKKIREYVDMIQDSSLDQTLISLISKLKKLYYNRKLNPSKKIKSSRPVKKRYIIGIKEVLKHLTAKNLKAVVLATNLEKVEETNGLDELVYQIIVMCRE